MIEAVLDVLQNFIEFLIDTLGYGGIVLAMAIESANIPLPSEVIMPISGLLAAQGVLNFWIVVFAGVVGNVLGSIVSYYFGVYGGRPFFYKYGKYVLVNMRDLDRADRWFEKYGEKTIFFSRLMPVVRTFISFPAGVTRMHMGKFIFYTFLGCIPFVLAITYVGFALGENWEEVKTYWHGLDAFVGIGLAILIFLYVRRHIRESREARIEYLASLDSGDTNNQD